jgi:hypothetical protein
MLDMEKTLNWMLCKVEKEIINTSTTTPSEVYEKNLELLNGHKKNIQRLIADEKKPGSRYLRGTDMSADPDYRNRLASFTNEVNPKDLSKVLRKIGEGRPTPVPKGV